jgi:hypothetical protein
VANRQRFNRTIQGTVDAAGTGHLTIMPPPSSAYWAVLTLSAAALGNPVWTISFQGQQLQSGNGSRISLSLHPLGPGETIDVDLVNAEQNSAWTGTIYGTLTDDEQDAMSMWNPALSASSAVTTQSPFVVLKNMAADSGIYTINDVATHTYVFNLPPNTQGFRWQVVSDTGCTITRLDIVGNNSGPLAPYANEGNLSGQVFGANTQVEAWFILSAIDTALTVTVQLAAGDVKFEVDAYVSPTVTAVQLTGQIGNSDNFAIVVRESQTAPPSPYQVPQYSAGGTVAVTAGTDFTLLAAVANFRWILFDCVFDTNSGTIVVFELWDGPSATGTKIGEAIQLSQDNRPMRMNLGGAQLTVGRALVGKCAFIAGGSSMFYTIPRSQVPA